MNESHPKQIPSYAEIPNIRAAVFVVQADSSTRDSTATAHVYVYTGSTCRYDPASLPLTPRQPAPSQVMIDIPANDPAHVTIRMPSPQGTASPTPASTPRTAAENQQDRLVSNSSCIVMRPDCINLPAQHGHKDSRSQAKMSL